jgi:phosphate transport system permease protein
MSVGYVAARILVPWQAKRRGVLCRARPRYYGWASVWWSLLAASAVSLFLWLNPAFSEFTRALLLTGVAMAMAGSILWLRPSFHAQQHVETMTTHLLWIITALSVVITLVMVSVLALEAWKFFSIVEMPAFLFGNAWSPQIATFADASQASHAFGALPVFLGTLLITLIALCVAAPLGIFSAIYLAEYLPESIHRWVKPLMEMMAGIPTVVFGYIAAIRVGPALREWATSLGLAIPSENALAAGLVMGIMIIPYILSLTDDAMRAVPESLREASLALGATKAETITAVVLPAATPGILSAVLLAFSRAIGETMIVTMAAGLSANLTFNPLESVTTVTAQIVMLLSGDQSFDDVRTLAVYGLGLTLFVITLLLNIIALTVVRTYHERYRSI